MCGIVAIVSRRADRQPPDPTAILGGLDEALALVGAHPDDPGVAATRLAEVERSLRGVPGVAALAGHHELIAGINVRLDEFAAAADAFELRLTVDGEFAGAALERANVALGRLRDGVWAIRRDRLRAADSVDAFAGRAASIGAIGGYLSIHQALSAIDRMEVRGRDSAGLNLLVWNHGLDVTEPAVAALIAARAGDPLLRNNSVRSIDGAAGNVLSFVYKAAAEIGELGDNTASMRATIAADDLLRLALAGDDVEVAVLGHTRWASVGIISEPNAHPVNAEELHDGDAVGAADPALADLALSDPTHAVADDTVADAANGAPVDAPYVVGVLNGDVDNHADLKVAHRLRFAGPITTDAKVIPAILARHLAAATGTAPGAVPDVADAFRRTVAEFDGSVAIGAAVADAPGTVLLALRGSGQGVYIGVAEDRFVVASEPYGVVEETDRYLRLDGESGGQICALDAAAAGIVAGMRRRGYDGAELPVAEADLATAEVTTRDIDRGDFPHFLLKEITESPSSFIRTLRGKLAERDGRLVAEVGDVALPADIAARLAAGTIRRIRVIGQGTAAIAGEAMAEMLDLVLDDSTDVEAITATELSGFGLRLDMRDTLAVAISQSGTSTDTNRTVDLLAARGAAVLAIVNRRGSDLTEKAHGVLYTSDGRDVEMSVASTKAFYAQVAAGVLLACAIAEAIGADTADQRDELLRAVSTLPAAMGEVLARRPAIADAAHRFAPTKTYWAIVGNGPNAVAAEELRIKLSELCYKSISCDITENKKHIDLSAEPLTIICAAGLSGSTADDVSKEVAIFRAHKSTPIVIADDGDVRYPAAATISVPPVHPALGFVLSTMAGHLFGYEAALAIDASARPLRAARELVDHALAADISADAALRTLRVALRRATDEFLDGLRANRYDGTLAPSTAVRLTTVLRDLDSDDAVERYQEHSGRIGSPAALLDELLAALTAAIEELTRPIDAIKHQAKTVTVGTSRSDEGVLDRPLVQAALTAGAGRDVLSYRTLKVLADLDPTVAEVTGYIRYAVDGDTIMVIDRGGIARQLRSRVDSRPELVGTKRNVASSREVLVARGRRDGRTVIFVPEAKSGVTTGITLLHVRFHDRLDTAAMRQALQGYDRRYDRLVDWVTETEGAFDERPLGVLPVVDLLVTPISEMADHWRS